MIESNQGYLWSDGYYRTHPEPAPPPVADDAQEVGDARDFAESVIIAGNRWMGERETINISLDNAAKMVAARDEAVRRELLDAISKRHEDTSRKAKRSAYHEGYADGMAEAKAIARATIEGTAKGGA